MADFSSHDRSDVGRTSRGRSSRRSEDAASRVRRLAEIKSLIERGQYETQERLEGALDGLLIDLRGHI